MRAGWDAAGIAGSPACRVIRRRPPAKGLVGVLSGHLDSIQCVSEQQGAAERGPSASRLHDGKNSPNRKCDNAAAARETGT